MDCNLPGFSVQGILRAIRKWFTMPSSRGSCQPRDRTRVSRIAGRCFTTCATRVVCNHEPQLKPVVCWLYSCITMWALLCCVSSVSSTTYKFHKDWAQIMFSLSSIQHRRYLTHWKLSVISFEQIHRWKKKSNCTQTLHTCSPSINLPWVPTKCASWLPCIQKGTLSHERINKVIQRNREDMAKYKRACNSASLTNI